jgi:putative endonuclease
VTRRRAYWVYILAGEGKALYTGVTGGLAERLDQHRAGAVEFTARYNIKRLVYAEEIEDVDAALRREKQIKRWSRAKKIALIERLNPTWRDLAEDDL